MLLNDDQLKTQLLSESDEFRKLHEEHHSADVQLLDLSRKAFLSGAEQIKERTLKKQKLFLKDKMEAIKIRFTEQLASSS